METKKQCHKLLEGIRVLVTGCGYRPIEHRFNDADGNPSHDVISVRGREMKLNIGGSIAELAAQHGAIVHLVAKSKGKLDKLHEALEAKVGSSALFESTALDTTDSRQVKRFTESLQSRVPLYWVQCVGLSASSYALHDGNPYHSITKTNTKQLILETTVALESTHTLLKHLYPIFKKQKKTKIVFISSMSGIRSYKYGASHCAAKGALDRYINAATIELYKERIFVSTIRPGAIDTGLYDHPNVQKTILKISSEYGGDWTKKDITLAPPSAVAYAAIHALASRGHVASINILAERQHPHQGS